MIVRIGGVILFSLIVCSCSAPWRSGVGRIQGTLFWDQNKNGRHDAEEVGLPNRKIYLYGLSDDSTRTDSSGNYVFANLAEGNYLVAQELRTSWLHSYPPSGMYAAQRRRAVNVGLFRQLCRIAVDIRNCVKPADWRAKYVVPKELQADSFGSYGSQSGYTGDPVIFGIGSGGNVAMLVPRVDSLGLLSLDADTRPGSWYGAGTWLLSIGSRDPMRTDIDFGTFSSKISGSVSLNGRDSTKGLAGWSVYLDGPSKMTTKTDFAGQYEFSDFEWGRYDVTLERRDGFGQTAPPTILTPSERWIGVRRQVQSRLAEIYQRAMSYHENNPMRSTSFTGFTMPSDLSQDSLASYVFLDASRDILTVLATLRTGRGSIMLQVNLPELRHELIETGDMVASGRSEPGTWFVDDPMPYTYDPEFSWTNFGVVRRGTIAGMVSKPSEGAMVYFAGPTLDSSSTDGGGQFVSPELPPGTYIVSCERKSGSGHRSNDTQTAALRRGMMRKHLNECARLLSLRLTHC